MIYTDFSEEAVANRLEGKECLSWIERFGSYLIESGAYLGEPEKSDYCLVIRMKDNKINFYYCYFYTNYEGCNQFLIQRYVEKLDGTPLFDMMHKYRWNDNDTITWWSEVFANNRMSLVDSSVLKHGDVRVSHSYSETMEDFVEMISKNIENAIEELWKGKRYSISKIYLAGIFSKVLPLRYALSKMYLCDTESFCADQAEVFYKKDINFKEIASMFYIPWKFRNMKLNISPSMTLGEIASTSGVSIPLPVTVTDKDTRGIETVLLADRPIEEYAALSWNDLIVNDNCADLQLDDFFFKDITLTVIPDGFASYYIGNATDRKSRIKLN